MHDIVIPIMCFLCWWWSSLKKKNVGDEEYAI